MKYKTVIEKKTAQKYVAFGLIAFIIVISNTKGDEKHPIQSHKVRRQLDFAVAYPSLQKLNGTSDYVSYNSNATTEKFAIVVYSVSYEIEAKDEIEGTAKNLNNVYGVNENNPFFESYGRSFQYFHNDAIKIYSTCLKPVDKQSYTFACRGTAYDSHFYKSIRFKSPYQSKEDLGLAIEKIIRMIP